MTLTSIPMMASAHGRRPLAVLGVFLLSVCVLVTGCGGPSNSGGASSLPTGGAVLTSMEYGRLVDIYAYRRIEVTRDDRRDTANRTPVLIAKDVIIRPDIESNNLFDASGNARVDADYRFLPFDVAVGHEELQILWDDQIPPEKARFEQALKRATTGLPAVPGSFKEQNTTQRPIPVIPRNAAICLNFDRSLNVGNQFFTANPNAIQVLQFITPVNGKLAFRPVPVRILSLGDRIILDTSLIGGEAQGGRNTDGLPASIDNTTANMRIALPTSGVVSKQIEFSRDAVAELNGVDSRGDNAVIRDFRSGNIKDGTVGALADVESPMVVTHLKMGIIAVDPAKRVLTINKRNIDAAIRGRIPYVDGALDPATGLAAGPAILPTRTPLRSGDVILQTVTSSAGEPVRIRAEVVMNLDVGNSVGDAAFLGLGMNRVGSDPKKPADGGQDTLVRVQVANMTAKDSQGNEVTFQSNAFPLGEDCEVKVHYYENVGYTLTHAGAIDKVSDAGRINSFLLIEPTPPVLVNGQVAFGKNVDPKAAISIRFTEPMNLETVEALENFMLTNETITRANVLEMVLEPKPISLSLLAASLLDHSGDGTLLQLRPPVGHYHVKGAEETYWCHVLLGKNAPKDMAGNPVDIFDRTQNPTDSFSVQYSMDMNAASNEVGYRVHRFAAQDEDGTPPGSLDAFGQFQLLEGELRSLPTSRFSAVADSTILSGITRFDRGECDIEDTASMPPVPPGVASPGATAVLYQCAGEPANGVSEPHNPRGSRLQMTYREDDFGLAYRDPTKYLIDVEQMHWAPWNDMAVPFDVFDRYSMRMAHCDWRPDIANIATTAACSVDCNSGRSGLRTVFDNNVLSGTTYQSIVEDKTYEINPNDAFRASTGTKFVPYPKFQKSFTWRDSRLIKWDASNGTATGFGGAHQPAGPPAVRDTTASISSPYVPDFPSANFAGFHLNTGFVMDYGDFLGFRTLDHDPIALPLLIDFGIFPDGPENGGSALGTNQFHIAEIGPCFGGTGYYSTGLMPGCTTPWPETRAHSTGGIDMITGKDIDVDPDVQLNARASVIKDILLGPPPNFLWLAPPKDDHVHWAQADFLRRVSMVTFGFFDSLQPNKHDFTNTNNPLTTNWPGKTQPNGIPDLTQNTNLTGIRDLVAIMDPPLSAQPVGTSVVLEFRGAQEFPAANDKVFNAGDDSTAADNQALVKERGSLLNPFFACEAYRYALENPFDTTPYNPAHTGAFAQGARIATLGLTPYVTEDRLDTIRLPNGLLPRYMNFRVIMENNVVANPPISPALKSFAIAFRASAPN